MPAAPQSRRGEAGQPPAIRNQAVKPTGSARPTGQVVDDDRAGQARIGAPPPGREPGMAQGQAADVHLVDHRLVIRRSRRPVTRPVGIRVGNDIARHERGAVAGADRLRRARPGEQRLVPPHLTRDGLAVRVEQQLRRIAPMTPARARRARDTRALAGPTPVKDCQTQACLGELDPRLIGLSRYAIMSHGPGWRAPFSPAAAARLDHEETAGADERDRRGLEPRSGVLREFWHAAGAWLREP